LSVPQCTYPIQFLYCCEKIVFADVAVAFVSASIAVLQGEVNGANCSGGHCIWTGSKL